MTLPPSYLDDTWLTQEQTQFDLLKQRLIDAGHLFDQTTQAAPELAQQLANLRRERAQVQQTLTQHTAQLQRELGEQSQAGQAQLRETLRDLLSQVETAAGPGGVMLLQQELQSVREEAQTRWTEVQRQQVKMQTLEQTLETIRAGMTRRQDELQRRQTDTHTLVHDLQAVVQTHRLQQDELMVQKEARWESNAAKLRAELKDPLAQLQTEVRRQEAAQLTFSHDLQAQEQRLRQFFEAGLALSQGRHEQDTARLQQELETVRKDLDRLLTSSKQHFTDQAAALGLVEKQAQATEGSLKHFMTWFSEAGAMLRMRGKP